ncbi:MAG: glutaredoxin [Candidatus Moraniibacteriota bacterium]
MMKNMRFLLSAVTLFGGIFFGLPAQAEQAMVSIDVLERDACGHCQAEREFLRSFQQSHPEADIRFHDVYEVEGRDLLAAVSEKTGLPRATPTTIIGGRFVLQGFESPDTTGKEFDRIFTQAKREGVAGSLQETLSNGGTLERTDTGAPICNAETGICMNPKNPLSAIEVPFTGKTLDVSGYSLPLLASVLGFIDGFNPCAMWVLVTFLLVLIQTGSRARMWSIAGLFIVAETVMYYMILNVWFTTFNFVGLDRIVTPIVGLVSIGGGIFFLYEWRKNDGTCQIVDAKGRSKISGQIKKLASEPLTWISAIGVMMLAFSVNVIEFACSIGIPQAFTKILEINHLGFLGTQTLMAIYIFFYMIDDFLVFGLALWGFEKLHLTATYSRWANLIGGILMLFLGALLVFAPGVLQIF